MKLIRSLIAASMLAAALPAMAQAPDARLRDQLRQSVTDLRKAQDENAALKAELDNLRRNGPATPVPAAAPVLPPPPAQDSAELKRLRVSAGSSGARIKQLEEQLIATQNVLAQWQDSQKKAVALARTRDNDAHQFETSLKETQVAASACESKNVQLVKIADELIDRYRGKSAWSSLRDQEPLLGTSRITFEQLGQEYRGRIIDASVQLPVPEKSKSEAEAEAEKNP